LAASIKAGVTVLAGGAAALTEVANAPAASAVEPLRMSRLENSGFFIVVFSLIEFPFLFSVLAAQPLSSRQPSGGM
jgi:hypothetical protein